MLLPHCRTQLVGHSSESADQIKQCIDDWVTAGSAKGRAFAVAGTLLKKVCCGNTLLVCWYRYLNLTRQMCVSQHPLFGVFYNTEIVCCTALI